MSDLGFTHRFVPATKDELPTLLMLHGTGGDENDLIPIGKRICPGAALLSPLGKIRENGMPRFFARMAEGVFDLEDLRVRTDELAEFIREAQRAYSLNGPIVAVGYSNGANIAANVLFRRPGLLAGAVLIRAMLPFPLETQVDLARAPVLVSGGRRDPISPPEFTEDVRAKLESCGAVVSVHWHEGGHELGQDDLSAAEQFVRVYWAT